MLGFLSIFGTAAALWIIKDIFMLNSDPKETKVKSEIKDPYSVGQMTSKDVKLREIMTLQKDALWSNQSPGFPDYHLAFSNNKFDEVCVELNDNFVRCDVEEKRVFRWLPSYDLSPSVDCPTQQECFVPFPIFKTSHRVIKYQDIGRFPIDEYILSLPQPTFRALQGPGLPFKGPAKRSIWSKVLYLYVQGYSTIKQKGSIAKLMSYNHTVAIGIREGLLDAIYGLTPN